MDTYLGGIAPIIRSLNAVRTNRQALAAANYAKVEAQNQIAATAFLRGGIFATGYTSESVARDLEGRIIGIDLGIKSLEGVGSLDWLVAPTAWKLLRREIEGVFIDAAPIYASGGARLQDLGDDLASTAGNYIVELAGDPTAVPARIAADIVRVVAHNAKVASEQASDIGTKEIAPAVSSISKSAFSILGAAWPLIIAAAVVGTIYVLGPAYIAKKVTT